jgi:hypothetical protein
MNRRWAGAFLVLAAPVLWAEDESGRGVARVSLLNGDVTMQRGDSGDWIAAAVNAPLVTGDKLYAGRASRAEVQLDHSNFIRLGEETEVRMADLENRRYQVQVSKGIATFRVLRDRTAQVEINTPAVAVRPLERGTYRIEVLENGETEITVRDGEAEVHSSQGTERLREGRTMVARMGPAEGSVEVQVLRAGGKDDWDRWNERRDRQILDAQSHRYVGSGIWGVEDLDAYGYWRDVDGYGWCWFPRHISVGWSPYSWGRWAWLDWYGWSWVGYEPWGWAPYHWGRWYRHPHWGWGWYPGPRYSRHYWSPAVVGFFGWGSRHGGFGIGFGYSNIGWVPLAPGDPFHRWWGRGHRTYIDNSVHITNINIRNVYRNAGVNGGIVSVHTDDFARGRVLNPRRVSVAEVGNAGQIRGLVPVVPERDSLRVTDREARAIPRTGNRDRFFTREQPRPVERPSFTEQRAAVERSVRGAFAPQGRREGGAEANAPGAATGLRSREAGVRPEATEQRGWRRFGEIRSVPSEPAQNGPALRPQAAERPVERNTDRGDRGAGWRRMGEDRAPQNDVVIRPQGVERNAERGWRRMGEDRTAAPQVSAPPPAVERRSQPESGFRRFEGGDRERDMRMQRFPSQSNEHPEQPRIERRDSGDRSMRGSGDVFRRSEPRMREPESGGGNRQIELNRPIVVPRSRGGDGGGGGVRMGAPPSAPRGDGGGRSMDRGGGDRGGGGGRRR